MNPESSLVCAWQRTLREAPEAIALIDAASGRAWTRADVAAAANAWQAEHPNLAGQVVAFSEPNGLGWLQVFLGLQQQSAIAVPLDFGDPVIAQRTSAQAIGASYLWREGRLEPQPPADAAAAAGTPCLLKLTSGSTGAPRALAFTGAEMMADGRHICAGMGISGRDTNLGLIPWGHSYGLGNLVMPLLLQGTAIVFNAPPLPHAIAAAIARHRVAVFPAVPALLQALADSTIAAAEFESVRTVISAGAPLSSEVARRFEARFARRIHSFYGSSETGGITYDVTGESAALGRGVGKPLPNVQLTFEDGDRFRVTSPAVFRLGNPTPGTHEVADLACLTADGELELKGRAGRFVKIAGRRLNLAEVEHALKSLPNVADAFVMPHAERADALAAAVATTRPAAELREALRERLAPWKIPKKIATLPAFPVTVRGKTDTKALERLLHG